MNDQVKNPDSIPGSNADAAGNLLLDCGDFQRQSDWGHSAVRKLATFDNSENLDDSASMPSDSALAIRRAVSSISNCSSPLANNLPFYLIALLLATTAIAKLWMLLTDPFGEIRVGIPREILWLSVAFELWLAFENFRIRDRRVLAFVNTVVFGLFAIFAAIRWMLGYGSCGCSGNLELPTWIFVLLDIGIVAWFGATVSGRTKISMGVSKAIDRLQSPGGGNLGGWVIGSLLSIVCVTCFSSQSLFSISSENQFVEPVIRNLRLVDSNLELEFVLTNQSNTPFEIIGFKSSCSCLVSKMKGLEDRDRLLSPQAQRIFSARIDKFEIDRQLRVSWYLYGATGYSQIFFPFTLTRT